MTPRAFVTTPLRANEEFDLPANASRHLQVLRLQPGAAITLFDGRGGEWRASPDISPVCRFGGLRG